MILNNTKAHRVHPFTARVLVPLYLLLAIGTTFTAGLLLFGLGATALSEQGFSNYCYHGGVGEGVAFILILGWPIVLFQIVFSLLLGRAITRPIKLVGTVALPFAILVSLSPCIISTL